ncbi:hypothetical protein GAO09_00165 [Rhizobiales bacterium RZME27]|jgi:hypothetical protein|uniref:Lipoprotein n=1 Tax=Endobacterium cereale TaxID=2663029 RepID=A0A6A8A416_9HYPH|nr:hypothetical protein [Endobacterium cereale]MQY44488.1 hypothetical protein [Endobacterium cereale]
MTKFNSLRKHPKSIFAAGLSVLMLAGCTSAGAGDHADGRRCSEYWHYRDCMYMQHHREREQLINQEKALINAEQARENLRMLREIRRKRGEHP